MPTRDAPGHHSRSNSQPDDSRGPSLGRNRQEGLRGGWLAGPSQWPGSELDRVGLFQLLDEIVGAKGGLMAGGHAKGRGLAIGERAQAVAPVAGRRPVAVELFGVEPSGRGGEVEVTAGG